MIYVMSDINGEYEKYIRMLKKIHLKDEDSLFILGNVIDIGANGIKVLQDMMMRPNVYPILGNHEYMALKSLPALVENLTESSIADLDKEVLAELNAWILEGGNTTIQAFTKLDEDEKQDIIDYLEEFVPYEEIEAGGREFVLVNAGLDNFDANKDLDNYKLSEFIYNAPNYFKQYYSDKILVTGHTPTRVIYAEEQGVSISDIQDKLDEFDKVYFANNHLAINCEAAGDGKLACVCLDTMKVFYV